MSFSEFEVVRRTRKGDFLNQIDPLIDWKPLEQAIAQHYAASSDATGRPAYPGLLLYKMLLLGIWNGGLSDEAVEDMANSNLHVMCFLGLSLEDNVPDHSVLFRFRTCLTVARSWDSLLEQLITKFRRTTLWLREDVMWMRASHKVRVNLRPNPAMKWSTTGRS